MRARPLRFSDAIRLLGGDDPVVARIERLLGGAAGGVAAGITVATVGGVDLFALRNEVIRWGTATVRGLRDRVLGLRRFDRTQRLVAAHAVIVVTSFYEGLGAVLAELPGPGLDLARAELTAAEQAALAVGGGPAPRAYADLVRVLLDAPLPVPAPHLPFERVVNQLTDRYRTMATALATFLVGLRVFEQSADVVHHALLSAPSPLPDIAIARYVEAYRELAVQAPEFGVWAGMVDEQATRVVLRESAADLRTRIDALRDGMRGVGAASVDAALAGLGQRYRARLGRSILSSVDAPSHVALPTLAEGYVVPHGLVAEAGPADLPAAERWWERGRPVADVQAFLLAHLTTAAATAGPLVVLGQPGSGKSVLTWRLAAALPASDFLVVRVELRSVRADSSIQAQIEQSLYQLLGERVSWPELVRRAGPMLPVAIVDGFDELLQATGINRADYLEQLREFQQREAELGRPVATLLTSRTVVADRARFPDDTVVVRLEPFDDDQVRAWLGVWNTLNEPGLRERSLRPLPPEAALVHRDLAAQPLLLLLLALYDAGANALQTTGGGIGQAELYERLFHDFVGREVDKRAGHVPVRARDAELGAEWRRLCTVGLAMFNRGADVITEAQLERDIPYLLHTDDLAPARPGTLSRPLTAAQLLLGRFFFIHESRAARDTSAVERSLEFLHATFGEFLAARQIVAVLLDLADERLHQRRRPQATLDAGILYAATSFATVARRAPLFDFVRGMLAGLGAERRQRCRELVLDLLPEAGHPHPTWSLADYEPRRQSLAARQAAFSANLVCLAVLLSDRPVDAAELVGEPVVQNWRRQALLWQSQLDMEDRQRMWQVLRVSWRLDTDPTRLEVRVEDGCGVGLFESVPWPPDERPAPRAAGPDRTRGLADLVLAGDAVVPADSAVGRSLRRSAFVQTAHEVREHLYPMAAYWSTIGDVTPLFREPALLSDADLLLRLLLIPAADQPVDHRLLLYQLALGHGTGYADFPARRSPHFRRVLLRQAAEDAAYLPVEELLERLFDDGDELADDAGSLARLAARATARCAGDPRPAERIVAWLRRTGSGADHLARAFAAEGLPAPPVAHRAFPSDGS